MHYNTRYRFIFVFNRVLLPVMLMANTTGHFDQGKPMSGGATEWEDLLIQHGIIKAPPKPEDIKPEVVYDVGEKKNSFSDSLDELDDDGFFDQYRYKPVILLPHHFFILGNSG